MAQTRTSSGSGTKAGGGQAQGRSRSGSAATAASGAKAPGRAARSRASAKRPSKATEQSKATRTKSTRPRSTRSSAAQSSRNGRQAGSANGSPRATAQRSQGSNGHGGVKAAREAVLQTTGDAGKSVFDAAKGAKGPLLAGSAALAGIAGGVALGASRGAGRLVGAKPHHRLGLQISRRDVATTAKEIGAFAEQLGTVAAEIRRTREAASSKHRSPIEVVLQGLTARH